MEATYIKGGRFPEAIWLKDDKTDWLVTYLHQRAMTIEKAEELFDTLRKELQEARPMRTLIT